MTMRNKDIWVDVFVQGFEGSALSLSAGADEVWASENFSGFFRYKLRIQEGRYITLKISDITYIIKADRHMEVRYQWAGYDSADVVEIISKGVIEDE
ncbi:MAG: hypothetical protein QXF80_06850 [Thermoplasmatales archaeon]